MMFWLIFLSIITFLWLLHYLHVTLVAFKYWEIRDVENEKPVYPLGSFKVSDYLSTPIHTLMENTYKKIKGPFAGFFLHTFPILVLKDPEIINRILVTDFHSFPIRMGVDVTHDSFFGSLFILNGEKWRVLKQNLRSVFTPHKLRGIYECLETKFQALEEFLMAKNCLGQSLDYYDIMQRNAVDAAASILMGIDVDYLNNPNDNIRLMSREAVVPSFWTILNFTMALMVPGLKEKLNFHFFRSEIENFSVNLVASVMKLRDSRSVKRSDYIDKLMEFRRDYPVEVLSAQVFVAIVAVYEASGGTVAFCLWELVRNPDVLKTAQEEVDRVVKKYGKINFDAIGEMSYIANCVSEALRLYPPLPFLNRICKEDYLYEKENLLIEKETHVVVPITGLHMDEKYYPEPKKFDPNRFLPEEKAKRPSGTYLPFGDGQRTCMGQQLGRLIIKFSVASVLRKFIPIMDEKSHKGDLPMKPMTPLLYPSGGCYFTLIKRH